MKITLPWIGTIELRRETDEERRERIEKEFRERFEVESKKYLKERK